MAHSHKNSAHVSSVVVTTRVALHCSVFTSREMAVNATYSLHLKASFKSDMLVSLPTLLIPYYSRFLQQRIKYFFHRNVTIFITVLSTGHKTLYSPSLNRFIPFLNTTVYSTYPACLLFVNLPIILISLMGSYVSHVTKISGFCDFPLF